MTPNADYGALPTVIEMLLSPEERRALYADLAEMARLRRKAEAESAHLWMP
jgi:hypothetical protein